MADEQSPVTPITEAERLARRFHAVYERMAPAYGYKTREASAVPWERVPAANRNLMIAVCGEILGMPDEIRRLRAERDEALAALEEIEKEIRLAGDYDHPPDTQKCCRLAAAVVEKFVPKKEG